MPLIDYFRDITGAINFAQWRFDIILRLLDDMDNAQEGLTTRGLCQLYFGADAGLSHMKFQPRHSGESRSRERVTRLIFATTLMISVTGFPLSRE